MPDPTNAYYLEQIDAVLGEYRALEKDLPSRNSLELQRSITSFRAVIHRVVDPNSPYAAQLSHLLSQGSSDRVLLRSLAGVVESLRASLKAGYLETASELIHGEVFGDFLEMADHLLERGYKDAAAVVTGSTLEAHLRQLCQKFRIRD